jgi:hypothetical protein
MEKMMPTLHKSIDTNMHASYAPVEGRDHGQTASPPWPAHIKLLVNRPDWQCCCGEIWTLACGSSDLFRTAHADCAPVTERGLPVTFKITDAAFDTLGAAVHIVILGSGVYEMSVTQRDHRYKQTGEVWGGGTGRPGCACGVGLNQDYARRCWVGWGLEDGSVACKECALQAVASSEGPYSNDAAIPGVSHADAAQRMLAIQAEREACGVPARVLEDVKTTEVSLTGFDPKLTEITTRYLKGLRKSVKAYAIEDESSVPYFEIDTSEPPQPGFIAGESLKKGDLVAVSSGNHIHRAEDGEVPVGVLSADCGRGAKASVYRSGGIVSGAGTVKALMEAGVTTMDKETVERLRASIGMPAPSITIAPAINLAPPDHEKMERLIRDEILPALHQAGGMIVPTDDGRYKMEIKQVEGLTFNPEYGPDGERLIVNRATSLAVGVGTSAKSKPTPVKHVVADLYGEEFELSTEDVRAWHAAQKRGGE